MKGGRKHNLILISLPLFLLFLVFILARPPKETRPTESEPQARATTFSAEGGGAKAVYLVMKRFLPSVERWVRPLELLKPPQDSNPTSLLVMEPEKAMTKAETDALDIWVKSGGQLIIAMNGPWTTSGEESQSEGDYLAGHGFIFSRIHTADTASLVEARGTLGTILMHGASLVKGGYHVILKTARGIAAGERKIGKGKIILIADGSAWSNDMLSRSSNAAWLVLTALAWDNGRLLVDEYHQGFVGGSRGTLSLILSFLGSFWGAAFIQLAAAGALFLAMRARRFGPLIDLPPSRARDPLARVNGIGALLEAAAARSFAAQAVWQLTLLRLARHRRGAVGSEEPDDAACSALVQRGVQGGRLSESEFLQVARRSAELSKEHGHEGHGHQ
jgi:hypothetical protein